MQAPLWAVECQYVPSWHFAVAPAGCWASGTLTAPPWSLHALRPAGTLVPSLHLTVAADFANAAPAASKIARRQTLTRDDRILHLLHPARCYAGCSHLPREPLGPLTKACP